MSRSSSASFAFRCSSGISFCAHRKKIKFNLEMKTFQILFGYLPSRGTLFRRRRCVLRMRSAVRTFFLGGSPSLAMAPAPRLAGPNRPRFPPLRPLPPRRPCPSSPLLSVCLGILVMLVLVLVLAIVNAFYTIERVENEEKGQNRNGNTTALRKSETLAKFDGRFYLPPSPNMSAPLPFPV